VPPKQINRNKEYTSGSESTCDSHNWSVSFKFVLFEEGKHELANSEQDCHHSVVEYWLDFCDDPDAEEGADVSAKEPPAFDLILLVGIVSTCEV
jgi:hypothetical protein